MRLTPGFNEAPAKEPGKSQNYRVHVSGLPGGFNEAPAKEPGKRAMVGGGWAWLRALQ